MNKVFCLGVWDMFHYGHLVLITRASKLGDLTVGIVCDEAVKCQKGNSRPIINQNERGEIIKALSCVSDCRLVEDFIIPRDVIEGFDVIVIGADQDHIKNLNDLPKEKIHTLSRYDGISTSDILKKIKEAA